MYYLLVLISNHDHNGKDYQLQIMITITKIIKPHRFSVLLCSVVQVSEGRRKLLDVRNSNHTLILSYLQKVISLQRDTPKSCTIGYFSPSIISNNCQTDFILQSIVNAYYFLIVVCKIPICNRLGRIGKKHHCYEMIFNSNTPPDAFQ